MSGSFPRSAWQTAVRLADALGLTATFGPSLELDPGYIGRDPRRRAEDLSAALRDESVRAIWLFRGGNSASEVLRFVEWEALAASPKVLVGYSDHAAVVLAAHAMTGVATFMAPVVLERSVRAPMEQRHLLVKGMRALLFEAQGEVELPRVRTRCWSPGRAQGPLIAANLTLLRGLLGTPFLPSLRGALLAWEEIGEPLQDVNAALTQIANAGLLDELAGMVVGHLEAVPRREDGHTLDALLLRALGRRIPMLKSDAFGHDVPAFPIPLGPHAALDASDGVLKLLGPVVAGR